MARSDRDYSQVTAVINGQAIKGARELARVSGYSRESVYRLLRKGYTFEQIAERGTKKVRTRSLLFGHAHALRDHEGREFSSFKDMAVFHGINPTTFRSRLKAGYSIEEALKEKVSPRGKRDAIVVRGVRYDSIAHASRVLGVPVATVRSRKASGLPVEMWFSKDSSRVNIAIEYEGRSYVSLRSLATEVGVPYGYLYYKVIKEGFSVAEAVHMHRNRSGLVGVKPISVVYRGVRFKSIGSLARAYGIPRQRLHFLITNKKLSVDEAVESWFHERGLKVPDGIPSDGMVS